MVWADPTFAPVLERFGPFARCVTFDKRGTGLSDRELGFGSLEERMDDIRAVVDAVGLRAPGDRSASPRAGRSVLLFAATYPDRVRSLALYGTLARVLRAPDYPEGVPRGRRPAPRGGRGAMGEAAARSARSCSTCPDTPENREFVARYSRGACTPRMARQILTRNIEIDVAADPPYGERTDARAAQHATIRSSRSRAGRYIAEHVPGARMHRARRRLPHDLGRRGSPGSSTTSRSSSRASPGGGDGRGAGARHGAVHRHRRLDREGRVARRPRLATAARRARRDRRTSGSPRSTARS